MRLVALAAVSGSLMLTACVSAGSRAPEVLDIRGVDSARAAWLQDEGQRYEASDVVVWVPSGVSEPRARALADSLNLGVRAVKRLVGAPLAWGSLRDAPVTYYLSPDRFISHGTGEGAVFISWAFVQEGAAPYKHEALHEIFAVDPQLGWPDHDGEPTDEEWTAVRADWLGEGLPDYVANLAAEQVGLPEGDVFDIGGVGGADATCRERLTGPLEAELLPFFPGRGLPPRLLTTARQEVAPTFYACAFSFSKHVAAVLGLQETVSLLSYFDPLARLEQVSGMSAQEWREEWLARIRARSGGAG